jgi:hypothetical protein
MGLFSGRKNNKELNNVRMMSTTMQQHMPEPKAQQEFRRPEPMPVRQSNWIFKTRHDPFNTRGFLYVWFVTFTGLWLFSHIDIAHIVIIAFALSFVLEQFDYNF